MAILAPISWRVPPLHYGPWEQFASLLTEGLVERGLDVTLFATANSMTDARLVSSAPQGYSEDPRLDAKVCECLHIAAVFEHASAFDLVHNSFDFLPLCFSDLVETPMVTTIHGLSSEQILPVYQKYNLGNHYVAISNADRHPVLEYAATIHHGIDMAAFDLGQGTRDYLLFFGRIHPEKGTAEAIRIAELAKLPLVIAGIVQDRSYFEREVEPHIGTGRVSFVGAVGPERKSALLGGARALLHFINFEEPFGFSVIEAMACGTPVIARRRGAMPELITVGVNGFLVDSIEDAVVAVGSASDLPGHSVRSSIALHFSAERMVDEYLALYERILGSPDRAGPRKGHRSARGTQLTLVPK